MKRAKFIKACIVSGLVVFVAGCMSIRVSQDYKSTGIFQNIKTYAWKTEKQEKTGDIRVDNPFNDERIRAAMDKTLSGKGFTRSGDHPDVHVSYSFSIRSRISSSPEGPVIGFGFGTGTRNSSVGFVSGVGSDISQYDEGLLVIDLYDGKTGDLLWRGSSASRIPVPSGPDKETKYFTRMVEKNLAQFPPGLKK